MRYRTYSEDEQGDFGTRRRINNMPRQLNILISEADYADLRREAYELHTTMSTLVRLSLSRLHLVPTVKPISVIQSATLVEEDEDLPAKSGPTGDELKASSR